MGSPAGPDAGRTKLRAALETIALEAAAGALRRVDRCWKGLANEEDIEAVHRLRTGTNRIRSLLKVVGTVCAWPQVKETNAVLQKWQKSWGPVRDLDVLILHLAEWSQAMDPDSQRTAELVLSVYRRRRAALYGKAVGEIGKKKAKQALDTLEGLTSWVRRRRRTVARGKGGGTAKNPRSARESIALLWPGVTKVWHSRRTEAERTFHGLVLHKFRLANKRLRHVLQLYKPVARPEWLELLVLVDDLHETLGVLHDIEVLLNETETLAARWAKRKSPRNGLKPEEMLLLLSLLDARRRTAFGHVLELWRELNRPEIQALLRDPVNPVEVVTPAPRRSEKAKVKAKGESKTAKGKASKPKPGKAKAAKGKAGKAKTAKGKRGQPKKPTKSGTEATAEETVGVGFSPSASAAGVPGNGDSENGSSGNGNGKNGNGNGRNGNGRNGHGSGRGVRKAGAAR